MAEAVLARVHDADVFVAVAAVADYTPAKVSEKKLKKSGSPLSIALEPTIDILATVASLPKPPYCVGFAAESHDVVAHAEDKRKRKKLPLIVKSCPGFLVNRVLSPYMMEAVRRYAEGTPRDKIDQAALPRST